MLEEKKEEENEYLVPEEREQLNLGRNQKIAVTVLGIFGVLIIIFWVVQTNRTLSQSLIPNDSNTVDSDNSDASVDSNGNIIASQANKNDARLKNQDTDGDGLSDWDELNTYHTSPYLADTDSDGIPDSQEVKNGTDPNCPQGQTCNSSDLLTASSTSSAATTNTSGAMGNSLNSLLDSALNSSDQSGSDASNSSTANNSASLPSSNNVSAASLRAALIASGFDKNTLDKISDTDLIKTYQESLNNSANNSVSN